MKVNMNFGGYGISSKGMGINRKKMDLIAENIANSETTKTPEGGPYKRKYLKVTGQEKTAKIIAPMANSTLEMRSSSSAHLSNNQSFAKSMELNNPEIQLSEIKDTKPGDMVFMPEHPDANENGYVNMPNVNIVTEMVDMIAATRGYEANVTAFNASKQIAKDSLDI